MPRTSTAEPVADDYQQSRRRDLIKESRRQHDKYLSTRQSNDNRRRTADRRQHAYYSSSSAARHSERQRRHGNYDDSSDSDASPVNHHTSLYSPDGRTSRNDNRFLGYAIDADQHSNRRQHRESNRHDELNESQQRSQRRHRQTASTPRASREPADTKHHKERHRRDSSSSSTDRSSSRERRRSDDRYKHRRYSDSESDTDDQQSAYSNRRSSSHHGSKTKIRPDTYDGKADAQTYLAKFRACSRYNGWDSRDKAAFLKSALVGDAASLLWKHADASYKELVDLLQLRFGTYERQERYRLELKFRRRKSDESLQELMSDISRLVYLAYPRAEPQLQDVLAVDAFLDSLNNVGLEFKIREAEPTTLRQAMLTAMKFEGLYNVRRQRQEAQRPRQARGAVSEKSSNSNRVPGQHKKENKNRSPIKRRGKSTTKNQSTDSLYSQLDRQGKTVRNLTQQLQELRCSAVTSPQPAQQFDQQSVADSTISRATTENLMQLKDEISKHRLQMAAMAPAIQPPPTSLPTTQPWQFGTLRPASPVNAEQLQQQQFVPPPYTNSMARQCRRFYTYIGAKKEPRSTNYLFQMSTRRTYSKSLS